MGIRAVTRRRDEDAFHSPFVDDRTEQIAHGRDAHRVRISLRLNHDLPAAYRIRIESHGINSPVSAGLRNLDLTPINRELFFKDLSDQMLEVLPIHRRKV